MHIKVKFLIFLTREKVIKALFFYCLQKESTVVLDDNMVFGRNKNADYVIEDERASNKHLKVLARSNKVYIQDLNTTNFTFVNESKIKPQTLFLLQHGDLLRIGNSKYIFLYDDIDNFKLPDLKIINNVDMSFGEDLSDKKELACSDEPTESNEQIIVFDKENSSDEPEERQDELSSQIDKLSQEISELQKEVSSCKEKVSSLKIKLEKKAS